MNLIYTQNWLHQWGSYSFCWVNNADNEAGEVERNAPFVSFDIKYQWKNMQICTACTHRAEWESETAGEKLWIIDGSLIKWENSSINSCHSLRKECTKNYNFIGHSSLHSRMNGSNYYYNFSYFSARCTMKSMLGASRRAALYSHSLGSSTLTCRKSVSYFVKWR